MRRSKSFECFFFTEVRFKELAFLVNVYSVGSSSRVEFKENIVITSFVISSKKTSHECVKNENSKELDNSYKNIVKFKSKQTDRGGGQLIELRLS